MRLALLPALAGLAGLASGAPTFHKDIEPILQAHCQECHRPGEIGPMPLLTYEQARPWAKAMKTAVATGKMPPWGADPHYGKFANDRSLSQAQIDAISAWVDASAPEGNPADAPKARTFLDGWNIAKPDVEIGLPKAFEVPAKGQIEYQYVVVPTPFKTDTWVKAAEVRPTLRSVVHHVVVFIRTPENKWLRSAPAGQFVVPEISGPQDRDINVGGGGSDLLVTYTPGASPEAWGDGQAKLIPAGSDLVFQLHYTANGKAGSDSTRVGLVLAKEPPKERVISASATNRRIKIPAGDANYQAVAETSLRGPATLVSLFPHMHLRGKAFQYDAVYPDGRTETLLKVNKWDLNWQFTYTLEKPLSLPAGSRIRATAWWDNSANNPANPDPKAEVSWGEQSWEEMLVGFFNIVRPVNN